MSRLARLLPAPQRAAPPPRRETYRAFATTVHAVQDLSPRMRRVTLAAPQFTDYLTSRADDFFALLIPGADGLALPPEGLVGTTPRGLVTAIPEAQRPELRWYTIRDHRPDAGEIDVDIVLHGSDPESGPGSRWASRAEPGDTVGFAEGNGIYNPPAAAHHQLFFADITAVPALAAILGAPEPSPGQPRPGRTAMAHVEVPEAEDIIEIDTDVAVHWHVRGSRNPGFSIPQILDGVPRGQIDYAWVCAEADLVKQTRRLLVREGGVSKDMITFSGYWRRGAARN
ncbi:siderophore-interacting protein [Nesterenkonia xinjiangensis]|uniref:NADPH-dependent ferric siderophore reductase n=1 Tax=Nesterenkonia xinjiangensis TaxID=225327 RepID=A0A7Z0GKC9_9MICC|nr:siderophore-interacting protein [Nesterenkonia xinjiangensis]NYJ77547.1 NADPH-dependent ferric siderophore reductase [Nesterenkonia xinjiangensis]